MLAAIRSRLHHNDPNWTFESAELDGDAVLVIFRLAGGSRYGVRYPLTDLPEGPNTDEPCETPADWAVEVWIDMEEQILTGGVTRADRTTRSDGLELLSWNW